MSHRPPTPPASACSPPSWVAAGFGGCWQLAQVLLGRGTGARGAQWCGGDAAELGRRGSLVLGPVIGVFVLCWFILLQLQPGCHLPAALQGAHGLFQFFFGSATAIAQLNPHTPTIPIFNQDSPASGGSCAASGPRRPKQSPPACCPCVGVATLLGFLVPSWS